MSKVLVIKAHPFDGDRSRTIKTLDTFIKSYQAKNPDDEVEILDLFAVNFPELDGPMMTAWGQLAKGKAFTDLPAGVQRNMGLFNEALAQFKAADKLVIANPMWNLSIPAKLKNWIDAITVVGETFRYTATGHTALVPDKPFVHIQAAGGKYGGKDLGTQYVQAALEYLGAKRFAKIGVEGMDHFPDQADEIVAAAQEEAKEVAAKF
ncbi:FMN-dependent NADH-azoreductase [Lactobacillus sp. LC28-10]|uniref:FMN dependent NADH:quinone oxidoreductase n=1 Tax=Secundilactobacillus angelensis TaxID=2722706 RepID=A0ABX1L216_9LACO|nr:NAD(P)H-dependent oxidoreductase [Secundilactobacillus angelensis]MCH5463029.1 NAD(P)H-dependent oxidoreductase [Secundilactobacillus angelensis]NLR19495.1 FMN-dependent NADH-azoreductase [Secundilactobacillus angelensis]